jgi:tRNA A37 threonylcarbamoyladenosine synthetase subunit TsaC/SUA5/YrdC
LTGAAAIEERFGGALGLILDGGILGEKAAPSTVVDVLGETPNLIREGAYPFGVVVKAWEGV